MTTLIFFYRDVEIEEITWVGQGTIYNFTLNGQHYQTQTSSQAKILIDYLKS